MRPEEILYEDNHLLVVWKRSGVPTQGDQTGDPSLLDYVRDYVKVVHEKKGNVFIGLVHRLDRPTEGIVVFAKTSKAASRLSEFFRTGVVKKRYRALLSSICDLQEGSFCHLLSSGPQNKMRAEVYHGVEKKDAQKAKLTFRVRKEIAEGYEGCSLVDVFPETGRKHQIRVQFATEGYPLVGDRKYGSRVPLKAGRIALCASGISFPHPTRPETVSIDVQLDESWPKKTYVPSQGAATITLLKQEASRASADQ